MKRGEYSEEFKKQLKEAFPEIAVDENEEQAKADLLIEDPKDEEVEETKASFKALGVKLNFEELNNE